MKHITLVPPILITNYWEAINQILSELGYHDCEIFKFADGGGDIELLIWYLANILTYEHLHLK